ncbi:NAD(+)/NADH kinase [[Clostridium] colinum]|uniref:NAD(+)/NADH kinase n=1 Tax=[Clostridium] colinum TaxID=36835 RepID=UPI002025058F|nr:NAD(+)/NADH kinase [[Clostridium] colinum]
MNIGIITNEDKDKDFEYTNNLIKFILKENTKPIILKTFKNFINSKEVLFLDEEELFKQSDFIVILGGDGTILRWAKKISKFNKNILGINIGNLGYLTDVEKDEGTLAIKRVLNNQYNVEKRMMLSATINDKEYICLNEVNINNGNISRMVKIAIDINDRFVEAFSADGLIISTPTGSTAYNLSAGGPILKPDTELIAITYVCPHALFSRPYVISANDKIRAYVVNEDSVAYLSLDGQSSIPINYGDSVYIKKSSFYTNIIKTTQHSFYDILRRKMFEIRK